MSTTGPRQLIFHNQTRYGTKQLFSDVVRGGSTNKGRHLANTMTNLLPPPRVFQNSFRSNTRTEPQRNRTAPQRTKRTETTEHRRDKKTDWAALQQFLQSLDDDSDIISAETRKILENLRDRYRDTTTELSNQLFRYIQLTHHRHNWHSVPKTLKKRAEQLVSDLHPPSKSDDLSNKYRHAMETFMEQIQMTTQEHIDNILQETKNKLRHLPTTELHKAKALATARARKTLGRLSTERREDLLNQAASLVGTNTETEENTPEPPANLDILDDSSQTIPMVHWRQQPRQEPTINSIREETTTEPGTSADPLPEQITTQTGTGETPRTRLSRPIHRPNDHRTLINVTPTNKRSSIRLMLKQIKKQTLVIGDSNLKSWSNYPTDWAVISYPGFKTGELADLIRRSTYTIPKEVERIVLAASINDSSEDTASLITTTATVKATQEQLGKRFWTLAVPWSDILPKDKAQQIRNFNTMLREALTSNFVDVPKPDETEFKPDLHHYTTGTGYKLVEHLKNHFLA